MVRSERLRNISEIENQIREDFSFIKANPKILGVILYGSTIYGKHHQRSDIDICIVTKYKKLVKGYNFIMENLRNNLNVYDIRFFKEFPLTIQGEIIEHGIPIISTDIYELYEYFFPFRKRYEDWKIKVKYCV